MTKGEAYRVYYEANKEKILEGNKKRSREKRIKMREAPEEEKEKIREKQREKVEKRRLTHYTAALDELGTIHKDNEYGSLYKTLAKSPLIKELTPTMFEWLCQVHTASRTGENNPE